MLTYSNTFFVTHWQLVNKVPALFSVGFVSVCLPPPGDFVHPNSGDVIFQPHVVFIEAEALVGTADFFSFFLRDVLFAFQPTGVFAR